MILIGATILRAEVLVVTKLDTADAVQIQMVRKNIHAFNPQAIVIDSAMPVAVDEPSLLRGKRVLVVEDGPTLTHGGMRFGAGVLAAHKYGASELVDPRPYAVGSIRQTFVEYPHIDSLLPAMGYGSTQIHELERTIERVPCDVVLVATSIDVRRLINIRQPTVRVTYELEEIGRPNLNDVVGDFLRRVDSP
jgi:predicted GTPase